MQQPCHLNLIYITYRIYLCENKIKSHKNINIYIYAYVLNNCFNSRLISLAPPDDVSGVSSAQL